MTEIFDVVVAGAGPVGLMLACELASGGARVLVVERLTEIDPTVKAGGITVPTVQAFIRRGLLGPLRDRQRANLERSAAFRAGRGGAGPVRGRGPGHFAGIWLAADLLDPADPAFVELGPTDGIWFVPQQEIEEILGDHAAALGIEVRRGVTLTDFTDDGDSVTIWLNDRVIRARWLVGCDGGRSTVRTLCGFDFPGVDPSITGYQALVEMSGTEGLQRGWSSTDTGIYAYGPMPGRILTVSADGPPVDRHAPVTVAELQDSIRKVSGVPVEIAAIRSATRFTDNTRQVTTYRRGRVLLAGDAAHVHSPFGGQGLNLGIGDAVDLGWKLAAVATGRMPESLLDSYTQERHPIGAWVLEWSRAQVAVMRSDPYSRAMRSVLAELLNTPDGAAVIHRRISGVLHRYDLGGGHDLTGRVAPDIELRDGSRLSDHCVGGHAVLLDLGDDADLRAAVAPWADRIRVVTAESVRARKLSTLLVRPDGVVAWARDGADATGLPEALTRWFGARRTEAVA